MKIKSNASPSEMNSSYYKANEEFCFAFEKYITKRGGKVNGTYNAWSFGVLGKINEPQKWYLMYKKATMSSTGNLLLSSKKQCLFVLAEWETERKGSHNSEFLIRKKTRLDFLRKLINKSLSNIDLTDEYILEGKTMSQNLFLN